MNHFGTILSKRNIQKSREAGIRTVKTESIPDFTLSTQQDYGTVNSAFGPLYSYKGLTVASAGPTRLSQSWNAAFGALYLANIQWDFFAFGKTREKIKLSKQIYLSSSKDLAQEEFQQKVKISGLYLNLLAAQTLYKSQKANLNRALNLLQVVLSRTKSGLNAGVDSSIAEASVSSAKISLISAQQTIQDLTSQINVAMGTLPSTYTLDTVYSIQIPKTLYPDTLPILALHPSLQYHKSLMDIQFQNIRYLKRTALPVFTLFNVFQGRGSDFGYNYGDAHPDAFSRNYFTGINPTTGNYLIGLGVTWNLTGLIRVHHQLEEQTYLLASLKNDYDLNESTLLAEKDLADKRIENALNQYREGPVQLKAARDAYIQKSTLYKNGLTTLVDLTQAIYALNQAETQVAINYNNVWTALLLKSAATGDFGLFLNQVPQ